MCRKHLDSEFKHRAQRSIVSVMLRVAYVAALGGLLAAGCTTVPQREFDAYRGAFEEVRLQGEQVLADYAAARQLRSNLTMHATFRANPPANARPLSSRLGLERLEASTVRQPDDIGVRLRAWEIVHAYNKALAAVAAGAATAETESSVNGFLSSLQEFPVNEVASMAAEAVPYAKVVSDLLAMLQKEIQARRFRQGILEAREPMKEFMALLRKDAVVFRNYRVALLNLRFTEQEIAIFDRADRFRIITSSHGWSAAEEVNGLAKQVNASRVLSAGVETFATIGSVTETNSAPAAQQQAELIELRTLADAIEREATLARATVVELSTYHELMRHYVLLIGELERTHAELARAAAEKTRRLPTLDQLEQIISNTRLAHRIYTETK
jgi:hypothetical protein